MEVRSGYKQTELGVIPEDWEVAYVGDLKPFITSGSRGWASYYSDRGSLFVRITNLSRDTIYLDLKDSKFVNLPSYASEGTRTQLQENDVLISITADIGMVGFVDTHVPRPAYINQHIALVRFNPSKTSGKFVSYFLASERPQKLFRASTDMGAKAGMSLLTIQKLQLVLPSLPEQRAITRVLSDVDKLLDALTRLIAKKLDLKQAAMQQLLTGQTRLSKFHDRWAFISFSSLYQRVFPKSPLSSADGSTQGAFPLFVSGGEPKWVDHPTLVNTQALIFSDGGVFDVRYYFGDFAVTDHCYVISVKGNMRFYAEWMALNRQVLDKQTFKGSGLRNLDKNALGQVIVPVPSTAEQEAIAVVLRDMGQEIAGLKARREKTLALRRGVMQELLTGRIRLT